MKKKDDFQILVIQWGCLTVALYFIWEVACR